MNEDARNRTHPDPQHSYSQMFIGAGYDEPAGVRIEPGQVVPLFITGLKSVLPGGSISSTLSWL